MPDPSAAPVDIVARLAHAAAAAIAHERPSLERGPGLVRGVTIELALSTSGQVTEAVSFIERRTPGRLIET